MSIEYLTHVMNWLCLPPPSKFVQVETELCFDADVLIKTPCMFLYRICIYTHTCFELHLCWAMLAMSSMHRD